MDRVERRTARWQRMFAHRSPGQCAHRHRRVRRTEGGEPGLGNGHPLAPRDPVKRGHVAGFALIGRHPQRGVALEVLNRTIPFAPGEIEIGDGHIVLEIDEGGLGIARCAKRFGGLGLRGQTDRADILRRCARNKGLCVRVPIKLAASLHVEVDHRGEPAGHGDQIAGESAFYPVNRGDQSGDAALSALGRLRQSLVEHREAAVLPGRCRAAVEHHHLGPSVVHRLRGKVAIVIGGRDHGPASRYYPEAAHIGPHRLAQHHARQVIVGKGQRAFDRAGGEYHFSGANVPIALG